MNSRLFIKCLILFDICVPTIVKRPLVLVYDGYSSHYNDEILEKVIEIYIILALLPANATYLF